MADDDRRLQFTRQRDLLLIAGTAMVIGYLLVRVSYGRLPVLPRLAGLSAAVLGIGEALAGFNIRARLRMSRPAQRNRTEVGPDRQRNGRWGDLRPLPPLVGARALMVAKASSLAGAGLVGLWAGLLIYVVPLSGSVLAAGADAITGVIGVVSALVMTVGALWLERCCVHPEESDRPPGV